MSATHRPAIRIGSADTFHIYNLLLSYLFEQPRTMLIQHLDHRPAQEHTSWTPLLDAPNPVDSATLDTLNVRYIASRILEDRYGARGHEGLVRWYGYTDEDNTWEPMASLWKHHAYVCKRYTGTIRAAPNAPKLKAPKRDNDPSDDSGVAAGDALRSVRLNIFRTLRQAPARRPAKDALYSTLMDAWPIGNDRCRRDVHVIDGKERKGPTNQHCVLCRLYRGVRVRETAVHAHYECPFVIAAMDTLLRGIAARSCTNHEEATRMAEESASALTSRTRTGLVTGYRPTNLMRTTADSSVDAEPFASAIAELHTAIAARRRRIDLQTDWNHVHIDTLRVYSDVWRNMDELARNTKTLALAEDCKLEIRYPLKDFSTTGPIPDWMRTWNSSGWANNA